MTRLHHLQWKPSCKTNNAKFSYDGVCADPKVFAAMLGLESPVKFKAKKMPKDEFEGAVGDIENSVRYAFYHISF